MAGRSIRSALMRYTNTPLSGATMGALSTAILQSSSATTVAVVGFVGAELMSFPNALGVIFGANIGTTITGWMVALLGFKLKLSTLALPLVFLGAILRLFAHHRLGSFGYALAGFGLIFIGITTMQEGMSEFRDAFTLTNIPASSVLGKIKLLAIGIIFTIITQSSSAGVAASLSALYTGLITFDQAATMVIGMDVGTTVTALLATVGGSVDARRTGLSHVIYNLMTALFALFLLSPYTTVLTSLQPGIIVDNPEVALVLFHTTFNTLGVVAILPFTHHFARFITLIIPENKLLYTQKLDTKLLKQPNQALNAAQSVIQQELIILLSHLNAMLGHHINGKTADLSEMQKVLNSTQHYVDQIHLISDDSSDWKRLIAFIHTLDHMQRLHERCEEEEDNAIKARESTHLQHIKEPFANNIASIIDHINSHKWYDAYKQANHIRAQIHKDEKQSRNDIMLRIGTGQLGLSEGSDQLQAARWLRRVSIHVARLTRHLEQAMLYASK